MKQKIGFLGMGIMGRPMARNLLKAGHQVTVYNRTEARCDEVVRDGALKARTPRDCAQGQDLVITCVTDSPDVEALLFGKDGAAEGASRGALFVDMSTISPVVARRIALRLKERGLGFLDAPVSGGDVGAQKGTLTIMVGGERGDFERAEPVLKAMGTRITHVGPSGAGQVTKAANQILCALNLLGVCEALALAHRSGIDLEVVHRVVTGGAGNSWSLENLGAAIIKGNFAPGFMVRLIQKDLNIVLDAARALGLSLPGTALATQLFRSSEAHGEGELGTQALFKAIERLGNFELGGSK
jgi:2-hydroxy-3-oxopropionate reductase